MSNCDGRIRGFDWSVALEDFEGEGEREKGLEMFVRGKGWAVWSDDAADDDAIEGEETVRIVQGGRKGRNGFFFPGFIGMSLIIEPERESENR